ncbi:heme ABC transporter substrate-binding protein IsdE [Virgibacillus halophilus]|uniref:High-affinity heme uptake system protein IsdE n=1 Tax=Tigheibacillus halophilus TaxID=361280 RepID=A0ABU5C269_9BACI|nr:heme ABC transporter substrate-binding protein IsdE [Virgibacillus halophilus]
MLKPLQLRRRIPKKETDSSPQRIVALSVAVAEIFDALDLDLVGIPTSYKQLPNRYKDAKELGNAKNPDLELMQSLKPTEVLSLTTLEYDVKPLLDKGKFQSYFVDLTSLEAMMEEITHFGEKYDRKEQAAKVNQRFKDKLQEIQGKTAGKDSPYVLILLGIPGSYLVATEKSYIGDLVKRVGGKNVANGFLKSDSKEEFLASNSEALYQSDPDIILRLAHGMPDEVVAMFNKEFKDNDIWKHFTAVKEGKVYDLEEILFPTTGTIRADEALEHLFQLLYKGKDE